MNVTKIFHIKCTKFNFGWMSAPGCAECSADPQAGFEEKGREGRDDRGKERQR